MKKNTNKTNQSKSAKKILVINCGGTISMCKENNVYIPKKENIIKAIKNYPSVFCELADKNEFCLTNISIGFRLIELEPLIYSSNLYPKDWIKLVSLIEKNSVYDGFVILHGTDTLAYTAAALSFMVQNFDKPIIVTGSQIPLIEPKSDGLTNFVGSLVMANDPEINQTCVFFGNKLFQGNRVKKFSSVSTNAFISPNFPVLGSIPLKTTQFNNPIHKNNLPSFHKKVSSGIKIIKLYPGFDLEILQNLNKKNTKALILETFGSGNAPTNQNFLNCLKKLVCENVLIINVSQCLEGYVCDEYETGNELSKIGIVSGKNITIEAAYAKLHFLFSCFEDVNEIKRLFQDDFVNEMND